MYHVHTRCWVRRERTRDRQGRSPTVAGRAPRVARAAGHLAVQQGGVHWLAPPAVADVIHGVLKPQRPFLQKEIHILGSRGDTDQETSPRPAAAAERRAAAATAGQGAGGAACRSSAPSPRLSTPAATACAACSASRPACANARVRSCAQAVGRRAARTPHPAAPTELPRACGASKALGLGLQL